MLPRHARVSAEFILKIARRMCEEILSSVARKLRDLKLANIRANRDPDKEKERTNAFESLGDST